MGRTDRRASDDQEGAAQAVRRSAPITLDRAAPCWSMLRINLSSPSAFAAGEVDAVLASRGPIVGFTEKRPAQSITSPFLDAICPPEKAAGA
jgi:hypothetical protein